MERVNASQVADAAYCEMRLKNSLSGLKPNKRDQQKAVKGNKKHEYQNRIGRDRRCFISTFLFGQDSIVTRDLRVFRDVVLMSCASGRVMVSIYYFVSPALIRLVSYSSKLVMVFKWLVSRFHSLFCLHSGR